METKEIQSLITLLDDPDKEVFSHVAGKLLTLGTGVIPTLENAWEHSADPFLQERIESLIHQIQFDSFVQELSFWMQEPEPNLFDGAVTLAKYQYHELDKNITRNYLDIIKRSIWLELNHNLTPFEQINVFNHVFYGLKGFSGKAQNDLNNYFIHKVIESKTGNALSLGLIYQILARELDIPVYGVNLPNHYVLAYCKTPLTQEELKQDQQKQVLFYINPLSKGAIFTRNEVKSYLDKINAEESIQCFAPCTNITTVQLLTEHLAYTYAEEKDEQKVNELKKALDLFREL